MYHLASLWLAWATIYGLYDLDDIILLGPDCVRGTVSQEMPMHEYKKNQKEKIKFNPFEIIKSLLTKANSKLEKKTP